MLIEILKFLRELFRKNYKAALLGLLLTPIFFYAISAIFGVNIKDHITYLVENSYEVERKKLVAQLEKINFEIDEAEIESHQKQIRLWSLLGSGLSGKRYSEALGIANRNQDAIRALLEFGKIYTTLVRANAHTEDTHERLTEMYQSIIYIIKHDDVSLRNAYGTLSDVNMKISQFPEAVRDEVHVEVLRYLSYCSAILKKGTDQEAFNNQALIVKERMQAKSHANPTQYRRKLYWVDLSRLVSLVNAAEFDKANNVFLDLRDTLSDNRFLKTKLMQHKGIIEEQFRDEWEKDYIERL